MALDFYTVNEYCAIDNLGEKILGFASKYGLKSPVIDQILFRFYEDPDLQSGEVNLLKNEINLIKYRYQEDVLKSKKVYCSDKTALQKIVDNIFNNDPIIIKINELITVCKDAINNQIGITCVSD
jgi:ABC-type transport system involved in Fe-S cluster assembly fused permease/ATPase subunit